VIIGEGDAMIFLPLTQVFRLDLAPSAVYLLSLAFLTRETLISKRFCMKTYRGNFRKRHILAEAANLWLPQILDDPINMTGDDKKTAVYCTT
jgi:hypothetical protein